ncbi:MAG TPA: hypothetical protein VMN39_04890 [Longimicrobiaceae bacterium]|nr:hypothetical protein [Longimicrobiaceae bacterium]
MKNWIPALIVGLILGAALVWVGLRWEAQTARWAGHMEVWVDSAQPWFDYNRTTRRQFCDLVRAVPAGVIPVPTLVAALCSPGGPGDPPTPPAAPCNFGDC